MNRELKLTLQGFAVGILACVAGYAGGQFFIHAEQRAQAQAVATQTYATKAWACRETTTQTPAGPRDKAVFVNLKGEFFLILEQYVTSGPNGEVQATIVTGYTPAGWQEQGYTSNATFAEELSWWRGNLP